MGCGAGVLGVSNFNVSVFVIRRSGGAGDFFCNLGLAAGVSLFSVVKAPPPALNLGLEALLFSYSSSSFLLESSCSSSIVNLVVYMLGGN